jgi:molybdopterin/thiamine biosynthesis adenylyltransferase/rhodanese-related sulfurtransferase
MGGQLKLKGAKVAIVGVGCLGCPAAMYLAAGGVGTIGLIDGDLVDPTNLQRQVLFTDRDVGKPKAEVAAARLGAMNGDVTIRPRALRLDSGNALAELAGYDLVIDGSDNFPTRYLVNDATVLLGMPSVHGSVLRFEGRVAVFGTRTGPCYRCLYPEPPPPGAVQDCQDAGVLGVMPGLIGVLQATEAIKWICGLGETLDQRLLVVDGLSLRFQSFAVSRDEACPMCATRRITSLIDYEAFCAPHMSPADITALSPVGMAARLGATPQVLDVREPWEWDICRIPGARLTPLGQLDDAMMSLDRRVETIVYCHHGTRSLQAARRLRAAGFVHVAHLEGGIDRWSAELDAGVRRY